MMHSWGSRICNMFECRPLDDDTIFQTLGHQPGQIYGSVNTDRCEARGVIYSWFELVFWDFVELGNQEVSLGCGGRRGTRTHIVKEILEPRIGTEQISKPRSSGRGDVLFTVVYFRSLEMNAGLGMVASEVLKRAPGVPVPFFGRRSPC